LCRLKDGGILGTGPEISEVEVSHLFGIKMIGTDFTGLYHAGLSSGGENN
jgi:hypothetical protein